MYLCIVCPLNQSSLLTKVYLLMTLNSTLSKHPYAQINLKLLSVKFQKAKKDESRHSSFSTLLLT